MLAATPRAGAAAGEPITFGEITCAPHWAAPNPGLDRFAIVNHSSHTATVYLFHADSGAIVATVHRSRAGSVHALTVRLSPGVYAWGCDLDGLPRHVSEAIRVTAHPAAGGHGPAVVPVQTNELAGPIRAYRCYVAARLSTLRRQLGALTDTAFAGDLASARQAWLSAHVTWLTIGQDDGAYGAFGDLVRQIDGTTAGLIGGTRNPRFTGFHKVELDLWRRSDPGTAAGDAQHLERLVAQLQAPRSVATALPATRAGVTAWTLRCHEILEDALRDSLSGDDDYGSGTALASVDADVLATREMLGLLAPLITPRSPYLVGMARRQLTRLTTAIGAAIGDGPLPIAQLARAQRERIDGVIGAVLETLAPVPDLLAIGST